jgi:hypothetical protein
MTFILASPFTSKAQGCISFSNNYAAYVDESADSTAIHVDVVVDGSGTMTINRNLPGCGSLPGQATHTPQISIWVTASPSGVLYGATTPGVGECANCYLSEETTQTIPIGTDTSWQGSWSAGVTCSMAGGIWGTGGYISIRIAVSTYKLTTINPDGSGNYVLACPETSKASCGEPTAWSPDPALWVETFDLYVIIGGMPSGACTSVGIGQLYNGLPAPFLCT